MTRTGQDLPPNERCPRCGGDFRCGVADPGPCACAGLTLTPALQAALSLRYARCVCVACLRALQQGATIEPPASAPT